LVCLRHIIKDKFLKIRATLQKYERFFVPGALLLGVATDFLTFRAMRIETSFILLGVYLLLAAAAIAFQRFADEPIALPGWPAKYLRLAATLVTQFTFGALLSASLVFYWFSGALSVSWPLLGLIALLMVANETLRKYYLSPLVQLSVFSFIVISVFSLMFPYFANSVGVWAFLAAGGAGLIFLLGFVMILAKFAQPIRHQRRAILFAVAAVFAAMNGLYFLNLIPPIPLSLREAGVFHGVTRAGANYVVLAEDEAWWQRVWPGQTVKTIPGERIFVFSSIFAPADLNVRIFHDWQYFDGADWVARSRPSFFMVGGRDRGYRGYSYLTAPAPGRWRVEVETERGQVIGRVNFEVQGVDQGPALIESVR
jgi:hypothetical protein